MIEFHLDTRSGVAPYLQLIQQVRQALRLGMRRIILGLAAAIWAIASLTAASG